MLSATAVTAQRIARKAELGQNQIRGVSDLLRQQRQTYVIPDSVFADLEVVIQYLKDIQRHSDDEFYSQFTQRRGRFSGEPGPTPGASARERAVGAATG